MTRLLHIVDPTRSGWPMLASLASLCRLAGAGVEHRVVVVGGGEAERRARAFGVPADVRVGAPLTRPMLTTPALRRLIDARGGADLLVAWSAEVAVLAQAAAPRSPFAAVLGLPPPALDSRVASAVLARCLRRSSLLVFPSAHLRDGWVARFTLIGCPAVVHPPSPPQIADAAAARAALRKEWEIADVSRVLIPLGEPEAAIETNLPVFLGGVLEVGGHPAAVVLPRGGGQLGRALRFASRIRPRLRVVVEDRPVPAVLAGCDIAVWTPGAADGTDRPSAHRSVYTDPNGAVSLVWAERAGVPIIAPDHPAARSVLGEAARARLMADGSRMTLASGVLRLAAGPSPRPEPAGRSPEDGARELEADLAEAAGWAAVRAEALRRECVRPLSRPTGR